MQVVIAVVVVVVVVVMVIMVVIIIVVVIVIVIIVVRMDPLMSDWVGMRGLKLREPSWLKVVALVVGVLHNL